MPIASLMPAPEPGSVDLLRFDALSSALGNSYARLIFVRNFLDSLPARVTSIIAALDGNEVDAALDSVLDLKIYCSMVGGSLVENRCRRIERHVRAGKFCQARRDISTLEHEASTLGEVLNDLLAR